MSYTPDAEPGSGALSSSGIIPPWKRALDVSCILLALPVVLPVGFFLGLLIKLVSRGPVLFKQERVGFRGSRFMCLKFRTMKVNANTAIHQGHLKHLISSNRPMEKLDVKGDPRLIPAGWIIRALGLDELPQLINVLRVR
jgi:lipopolysaccharide/colanic/teichoic acid biosynthesis glycosyltransferase